MNLDLENLENLIKNEKPYKPFRLKQVEKAVYKDLIDDWQDATYLPAKLREKLNREIPLSIDLIKVISQDKNLHDKNTVKAVIKLNDGLTIETVLMRHLGNRNTVCVSSQVGCPLNCIFCRTGKIGYERNLTAIEIVEQVLFFARYLKKSNVVRVTNVVFMGMGEPFLNYDNVMKAIRLLNEKNKFNIGARKISISTCGIPEKIKKLADENLQINLAISLSAPNDELRSKIMPVNIKYPIRLLLDAVKEYIVKTNRKVMFEYVLINNLNDSLYLAMELSILLKDILCFINIIPFNGRGNFSPPPAIKIKKFKNVLEKAGLTVTERYRFGRDISAACGQLVYAELENREDRET
jgi:23S rRNA (adenine2503-C2)-methyltransferase